MGDVAHLVPRDVPVELGQGALGQVVRLQLVGVDQLAQLRHHVVMPADDTLEHPLVGEMVGAAAVPVALGGGVEKRQVFGGAALQEALLQSLVQRLWHGAGHKTAGGKGHAVLDHFSGLGRSNHGFFAHMY